MGTYLQCMHFVTFCMQFFGHFPVQHITFIGIFARQIFYEIVLRATFNPGFGYIQLETSMFLFNLLEDFKCLFSTHISII